METKNMAARREVLGKDLIETPHGIFWEISWVGEQDALLLGALGVGKPGHWGFGCCKSFFVDPTSDLDVFGRAVL